MITLLLQGVCIALLTIAAGFIFIEIKAKLDKTFLYWAFSLIVLTFFCAIDLWIQPAASNLFWTNIQHILICLYPTLVLLYVGKLLKKSLKGYIWQISIAGLILSSMFICNIMLIKDGKTLKPSYFYLALFLPFLLTAFYIINTVILRNYHELTDTRKKIIRCHIISFTLLTICGLLDLYRLVFNPEFLIEIMSFTILGTISMSLVLATNFSIFLVDLIRSDEKHEKLELAYKELEEARALSELGKSSAIINHEIRNYTTTISGYAELILLKGNLDDRFKDMAQKIINSVKNLQSFSNDILDFSKSKILQNMQPVNLTERINKTIKMNFHEKESCFDTFNLPEDVIIHGDWQKLDHVFLNLFNNAFQAGAQQITLKADKNESTILLSVADDGKGIDSGDPHEIFKAFYSTKGTTGTGLGLSITRSVVESHGGHINVISKNQTSKNSHGLVFTLVFPNYPETQDDTETIDLSIILIKDGTPNFEEIVRVFRNVFINPEIIGSFNDLKKIPGLSEKVTVLGNAESIGKLNVLYKGLKGYTIVDNPTNGLSVIGNEKTLYNGPFNEEFILNYLHKKKKNQ